MKKLCSVLLVIVMILSLAACKAEGKEKESSKKPVMQAQKEETPPLDIVMGSLFNEGMAMVTLRDKDGIYAIDETGAVLFSITDEQYYPESAFHDGIAVLYKGSMNRVLCKKDGTLVYPEDLGATMFYDPFSDGWDELLGDGFILATNEDNKTFGVLNTKLEWIVPLSADLYALLDENNFARYYNGYILLMDGSEPKSYIDLRTGEVGDDLTKVKAHTPSDLYYIDEDGNVNDSITGETLFAIEDAGKLVNGGVDTYFRKGKVLVQDLVVATSGDHYFMMRYYVIDDTGNYIVEPVEKTSKMDGAVDDTVCLIQDHLIVAQYSEQIVHTENAQKTRKVNTEWTIYDLEGNALGSYRVDDPTPEEGTKVHISITNIDILGDRVKVEYVYTYYHEQNQYASDEKYTKYFSLNFQPLF